MSVNPHHTTHRNESSIAEVTQTFHKENSSVIHVNPKTIPFGINRTEFNSSIPDAIWYTLTERKEANLPNNLLVIYDTGSEELFCLDFNTLDDKNEPRVVSFVPGMQLESQTYEIIANDFGDFLLDLVKEEL